MYVIYFTGFLEQGYVRSVFYRKGKQENQQFKTEKEVLKFATKYKFRWYANFLCWMYNKNSINNFRFRIYSVKKLTK